MIISKSCEISRRYNIPVHLIERQAARSIIIGENPYYAALKREFDFSSVKYKTFKTTSVSAGGIPLKTDGQNINSKIVPIKLLSVLYKVGVCINLHYLLQSFSIK